MKVTALENGFYGSYRKEGDIFDVEDGEKATWFAPLEEDPVPGKPKSTPASKSGKQGDALV